MLLMPPSLVQRAVAGLTHAINTGEGVRATARVLEVGIPSLLHHLRNTGFIGDADRERIEDEIVS